jgi:hypothetical protein
VISGDIGSSSCSGLHDVVVLVLGKVVEIEGIFIDRCLDAQGQLVLRRDLNLQAMFQL